MLRMMAERMVRQQKAYHGRVQELMTSYQEMAVEREAMRSILLKDSTAQQQKETIMLESFRNWFREEDKKLSLQERSLSSSSPPLVDCRTDIEKEIIERNESVSISYDPLSSNRATGETTKVTTTTIPTVQEKVRPDPVPTISSTAIATTTTISRVPIFDGDKQQRPSQKEPREAPA